MQYDKEGFRRPFVNRQLCVKCGLCEKACPILNPPACDGREPLVFAAWNNDSYVRYRSSSGGMFSVFAESVLAEGGSVYGVAYDSEILPAFVKVENAEDLKKIRPSKYAEAKDGPIFRDVLADLKTGRKVLFSGTPCQVAGLRSFLGKDYDNLVTLDLCCHGAPSSFFFRKRKESIERRKGEKITNVVFRDKRSVWGVNVKSIFATFESGEEMDFAKEGTFYSSAFLKNYAIRKNCGKCPYARLARVSDVTLGDFWGLGYAKAFDYPKKNGVSLILANTDRGREAVEATKDMATYVERPLAEAVNGNKTLRRPSPLHPSRGRFIADLTSMDYEKFEAKWRKEILSSTPLWKVIGSKCKRLIYNVLKLH